MGRAAALVTSLSLSPGTAPPRTSRLASGCSSVSTVQPSLSEVYLQHDVAGGDVHDEHGQAGDRGLLVSIVRYICKVSTLQYGTCVQVQR